ncbi:MAG: helix-turn-helix domain-containing protein [Verrucomicrobia bacterium]|nr:helix-turn-helix domain-containing protein [Verrucomicrobiota bacterium]
MERFLAEHYAEDIDVPQVARAAGVHPQYASALFRDLRGRPLVEALARRRVAQAQLLLRTTDATVLDVALTSGFQSLSRFYAAFRRFVGQSPAAFRAAAPLPPAESSQAPVLHVLWIDDQPLNNLAERRLLATRGLFTDAYTDNRSALRALEHASFDLIISDIHRGRAHESGWDLLRELRRQNLRVPFFFYTGDADARLRHRAERASAHGAFHRSGELLQALLLACGESGSTSSEAEKSPDRPSD